MKLPELGENVTAGDVVRVLVKAGDTITKDQAILELETDKATIEVPSSVAGLVKDVQVKPGQKLYLAPAERVRHWPASLRYFSPTAMRGR